MTRVAAVDVGTNSVRLLVADPGTPLTTVERFMRVTRLGAGVDANGHLDDAALERTLDCLSEYAQCWQKLGARRVGIAATSAVRDAADRERFFEGVRARTGTNPRVLSGEEEARIAFTGATSSIAGQPPYLVLDIGGGSTELILGTDQPQWSTSRQLGCVRLTERALPSDPPTPAELKEAAALTDAVLQSVLGAPEVSQARTLVGVAGTVTTLAALHLGLDEYEPERIHGTRMPRAAVQAITRRLAGMTTAQRSELGPMAPGREDVIVGGAIILERAMALCSCDEVLVSEADILDGLALELLDG